MSTRPDRKGKPVAVGTRVKWVGGNLVFSYANHQEGYSDVHTGAIGTVMELHPSCLDPKLVLVMFDGHTRPVTVGLPALEAI